MKTVGIYKIQSPTNKIYIGQSVDIRYRVYKYSTLNCKKQRKLYASLVKYGWENHKFEVLHYLPCDVSQDVLNVYEDLYLNQYKKVGIEVLNIREAGRYGKISEETKKRISESLKIKYQTTDLRETISIQTKKGMLKSNASEKISSIHRGRKLSKEHKDKISKAGMGRVCPKSSINILKAHEKLKGRKQSDEEKSKRAKKNNKKIQVDGVVYLSVKEYSILKKLNRTLVWRRLNSEKHPNFKYLKKQP